MTRGTTSSITIRFLVELLDRARVPVDDLLAQAGLDRTNLQSPELRCPLQPFDAIWERAATRQPDIGLSLIDRFPPGQMHVVTHLALRSATIREALDSVSRYVRVTQENDRISVEHQHSSVRFSIDNAEIASGRRHNPWLIEHFLSMSSLLFTRACGRPLPLQAVTLKATPQAPLAAYQRRFGLLPEFSATTNSLLFDATALEWPLQTHDAYLHGILAHFADQQLPAQAPQLLDQVNERLRSLWASGNEPKMAAVATHLGITVSQLRSRLTTASESFRALKDASRRDLARIHLAGELSIGEIAYLLGFSEPAALQHACRRWFGQSAGECRGKFRSTSA